HILRNSIDHGIEDGRARIEAGKDMCGRIDIVGEWQEDQLRLTIQDDGRGVDVEALMTKAGSAPNITLDQKLSLMLSSGVSTARELSEISGRGIGMDAVKIEIERLGGHLLIEPKLSVEASHNSRFVPFRLLLEFPRSLFRSESV
ncbi:MAG: chemotaxis protein CheA, partial [Proteobacteria bacterium]